MQALDIRNRKGCRRKQPHGMSIEVLDVRAVVCGGTDWKVMGEYGKVKYSTKR